MQEAAKQFLDKSTRKLSPVLLGNDISFWMIYCFTLLVQLPQTTTTPLHAAPK